MKKIGVVLTSLILSTQSLAVYASDELPIQVIDEQVIEEQVIDEQVIDDEVIQNQEIKVDLSKEDLVDNKDSISEIEVVYTSEQKILHTAKVRNSIDEYYTGEVYIIFEDYKQDVVRITADCLDGNVSFSIPDDVSSSNMMFYPKEFTEARSNKIDLSDFDYENGKIDFGVVSFKKANTYGQILSNGQALANTKVILEAFNDQGVITDEEGRFAINSRHMPIYEQSYLRIMSGGKVYTERVIVTNLNSDEARPLSIDIKDLQYDSLKVLVYDKDKQAYTGGVKLYFNYSDEYKILQSVNGLMDIKLEEIFDDNVYFAPLNGSSANSKLIDINDFILTDGEIKGRVDFQNPIYSGKVIKDSKIVTTQEVEVSRYNYKCKLPINDEGFYYLAKFGEGDFSGYNLTCKDGYYSKTVEILNEKEINLDLELSSPVINMSMYGIFTLVAEGSQEILYRKNTTDEWIKYSSVIYLQPGQTLYAKAIYTEGESKVSEHHKSANDVTGPLVELLSTESVNEVGYKLELQVTDINFTKLKIENGNYTYTIYRHWMSGPDDSVFMIEQNITLVAGDNEIKVTALDSKGNETVETFNVTLTSGVNNVHKVIINDKDGNAYTGKVMFILNPNSYSTFSGSGYCTNGSLEFVLPNSNAEYNSMFFYLEDYSQANTEMIRFEIATFDTPSLDLGIVSFREAQTSLTFQYLNSPMSNCKVDIKFDNDNDMFSLKTNKNGLVTFAPIDSKAYENNEENYFVVSYSLIGEGTTSKRLSYEKKNITIDLNEEVQKSPYRFKLEVLDVQGNPYIGDVEVQFIDTDSRNGYYNRSVVLTPLNGIVDVSLSSLNFNKLCVLPTNNSSANSKILDLSDHNLFDNELIGTLQFQEALYYGKLKREISIDKNKDIEAYFSDYKLDIESDNSGNYKLALLENDYLTSLKAAIYYYSADIKDITPGKQDIIMEVQVPNLILHYQSNDNKVKVDRPFMFECYLEYKSNNGWRGFSSDIYLDPDSILELRIVNDDFKSETIKVSIREKLNELSDFEVTLLDKDDRLYSGDVFLRSIDNSSSRKFTAVNGVLKVHMPKGVNSDFYIVAEDSLVGNTKAMSIAGLDLTLGNNIGFMKLQEGEYRGNVSKGHERAVSKVIRLNIEFDKGTLVVDTDEHGAYSFSSLYENSNIVKITTDDINYPTYTKALNKGENDFELDLVNPIIKMHKKGNDIRVSILETSFISSYYKLSEESDWLDYTKPFLVSEGTQIFAENRVSTKKSNVVQILAKREIDSKNPLILISNIEDGHIYTSVITPSILVFDESGEVNVLSKTLNSEAYVNTPIGIADGVKRDYTLYIKAVDEAGNISEKTVNFSVNIPTKVTETPVTETPVTETPVIVTPPAGGGAVPPSFIPSPPVITSTVKVTLDQTSLELEVGSGALDKNRSFDLTESIIGTDNKEVKWYSKNKKVATVDSKGIVTAVSAGKTEIYVQIVDSKEEAYCQVEVFLTETDVNPLGQVDFGVAYISGYTDGTFKPDNIVKRAEVATMFVKIMGLDINETGDQKFTDVDPNHWSYKYVQAMSKVGLFSGYADNTFRPNQPISRAEIAQVFTNYWKLSKEEVDSTFVEIKDVGTEFWASKAIYRMYNEKIFSGYDDGSYKPNDDTLRKQIVVMINKLVGKEPLIKDESKFKDIDVNLEEFGHIEAASEKTLVE